jgi:hypothetical protein
VDRAKEKQQALVVHQGQKALVPLAGGGTKKYVPSVEVARRLASKWPRPVWHAPWQCYRVMSGHLGCVSWHDVCSLDT